MAKKYRTSHRMYSAWNYEREIEDLNRASQQGWQLVKGGCFSSRFVRNTDVQYRYQLDFQREIENMGRYIEMFQEQGWEYINTTFNGWSYFRKAYDPALPEIQYEIFTDRSSLQEMNGRWVKMALTLTVIMALFAAIQIVHYIMQPMLPTLVQIVPYAIAIGIFLRGMRIMRKPERRKNVRWDSLALVAFLIALVGGNAASLALQALRTDLDAAYSAEHAEPISAEHEEATLWEQFEVKYPDSYYMDLEFSVDAPLCVSIVDSAGDTVYSLTDSAADVSDVRLKLKRGEYSVFFSDYSGGRLEVEMEID